MIKQNAMAGLSAIRRKMDFRAVLARVGPLFGRVLCVVKCARSPLHFKCHCWRGLSLAIAPWENREQFLMKNMCDHREK